MSEWEVLLCVGVIMDYYFIALLFLLLYLITYLFKLYSN